MFNALFALCLKYASMHSMTLSVGYITKLIELFEEEFSADKDAKNAAIDSVIQILQNHKDK